MLTTIGLCLALCFTEIAGQALNCGWVNSMDCGPFPNSPVCGTDGRTYKNTCLLAKAQCQDSGLQMQYNGPCPATSSPGVSPTTTVTTTPPGQTKQHLDCAFIRSLDCTTYPDQLTCATSGVTFKNVCYLARTTCSDSNVQKAHDGACVTTAAITHTTPTTTTPTTTTTTTTITTPTTAFLAPTKPMSSRCKAILNTACPSTFKPVCDNNGNVYPNICYGSQAECRDSSLRVYEDGSCFSKFTNARRAVFTTTHRP